MAVSLTEKTFELSMSLQRDDYRPTTMMPWMLPFKVVRDKRSVRHTPSPQDTVLFLRLWTSLPRPTTWTNNTMANAAVPLIKGQ